jgi:hypothetical protein
MSITMSITSGKALVSFTSTVAHSKSQRESRHALYVDGVSVFAAATSSQTADDYMNVAFTYLVTGLSSGSHTFQIRWRINNVDTIVTQPAASAGLARALVVTQVN